jgi:uncharacterized membrane protein YphA (DoxX/SURF4 family)
MMHGTACLAGTPSPVATGIGLLAIALGALLVVGFLTPFAAALIVIGSAALAQPWWPVLSAGPDPDRLLVLLVAAVAIAVVPLGPGAFSLDARLFGRREIVIPAAPGARS